MKKQDRDPNKIIYPLCIDRKLWNKFKGKCGTEGKTMLSVIIEKIKEYVR